jgi:hypothetical protein
MNGAQGVQLGTKLLHLHSGNASDTCVNQRGRHTHRHNTCVNQRGRHTHRHNRKASETCVNQRGRHTHRHNRKASDTCVNQRGRHTHRHSRNASDTCGNSKHTDNNWQRNARATDTGRGRNGEREGRGGGLREGASACLWLRRCTRTHREVVQEVVVGPLQVEVCLAVVRPLQKKRTHEHAPQSTSMCLALESQRLQAQEVQRCEVGDGGEVGGGARGEGMDVWARQLLVHRHKPEPWLGRRGIQVPAHGKLCSCRHTPKHSSKTREEQ